MKKKRIFYLPGYVDDGVEDARESESDARKGTMGEESGVSKEELNGVNEEIEAAYGRNVESERHSREGNSKDKLQHSFLCGYGLESMVMLVMRFVFL
ncbi:hypothetical protein SESBI_07994 [Sesbania bispinosa]|nr:hypothetical protein SESBI_07994 [Sesbania bispinosa]